MLKSKGSEITMKQALVSYGYWHYYDHQMNNGTAEYIHFLI